MDPPTTPRTGGPSALKPERPGLAPATFAAAFQPIGLAPVQAMAALQDRVDVKYVIPLDALAPLTARLLDTHRVLELDGRRAFRYLTTYFDTADLRFFRDHMQRRRRRVKCRSREYVDSEICAFEVKVKGTRGRTIKHRMAYESALRDQVTSAAEGFLAACVEGAYRGMPEAEMEAALTVTYSRVTFAAPEAGERLTCDFGIVFRAPDGASGRLAEDHVIVESKSLRGNAIADRALRGMGIRPERHCSKYCLGVGVTRPHLKSNALRPLLTRHFRSTGPTPGPATPLGGRAIPAVP